MSHDAQKLQVIKTRRENESGVEPACLTADEGVCTLALPLEPELMSHEM